MADRERLNRVESAKTHQSMIKSLLCEMVGTYTADAAEGHTPMLRIRQRLEEIRANRTNVNPGRSAVDIRFATAYSDDAYLNMACVPVWTGPGADEYHDLVGDVPPAVRRASAIGMLDTFKKLLEETNHQAKADLSAVAAYVGWLLDVPEIREAVLSMAVAEPSTDGTAESRLTRAAASAIDAAYNTTHEAGVGTVVNLADGNPEQFRAVLEALHLVTDSDESPMQWANDMVRIHVFQLVESTSDVEDRVLAAIDLLPGPPNSWHNLYRVGAAAATGAPTLEDALMAANVIVQPDNPVAELTPEQRVLYTDVAVDDAATDSRIGDVFYVAWRRLVNAEPVSVVDAPGWMRLPGPSPFWDARSPADWSQLMLSDPGGYYPATASTFRRRFRNLSKSEVWRQSAGRVRDYDDGFDLGNDTYEERQFVRYTLLRGTCALRGVHEQYDRDRDGLMVYSYPRGRLHVEHDALDNIFVQTFIELPQESLGRTVIEARRSLAPAVLARVNQRDAAFEALAAKPNLGDPHTVPYEEPARACRWAPVTRDPGGSAMRDPAFGGALPTALSRASALEVLISRLTLEITRIKPANQGPLDGATRMPGHHQEHATLLAVRAALKIMQLESIAEVATVGARDPSMDRTVLQVPDNERLITRPVAHKLQPDGRTWRPMSSVAPGLARFVHATLPAAAAARSTEPVPPSTATERQKYSAAGETTVLGDGITRATSAELTNVLNMIVSTGSGAVHIGAPPTTQPYAPSGPARPGNAFGDADQVPRERTTHAYIMHVVRGGIQATSTVKRVLQERALAARVDDETSDEHEKLYGKRDAESLSRDRRGALWEDCMRQVSVSTDRFLAFARKVSGKLGEDVSEVLANSDAEMEAAQKELTRYRKTLQDRTFAFQSRLVAAVLDAAVKSSKLQLEFGGNDPSKFGDNLVVVNRDLKESVEKLTTSSKDRAFFQTSVQLKEFMENHPDQLSLGSLMAGLVDIGTRYHQELASKLSSDQPGQRLSLDTLTKPHNLYLVKFKSDFYAALGTAFASFTTTMRNHYRQHVFRPRDIALWELVETDPEFLPLNEAFSAFVALALQWTRNNASSRVVYVTKHVHDAVGNSAGVVRQQLIGLACEYLMRHPNRPRFLSYGGREAYYGGRPDAVVPQPPCNPPLDYGDPLLPRAKFPRTQPPPPPPPPRQLPYPDLNRQAVEAARDRLNLMWRMQRQARAPPMIGGVMSSPQLPPSFATAVPILVPTAVASAIPIPQAAVGSIHQMIAAATNRASSEPIGVLFRVSGVLAAMQRAAVKAQTVITVRVAGVATAPSTRPALTGPSAPTNPPPTATPAPPPAAAGPPTVALTGPVTTPPSDPSHTCEIAFRHSPLAVEFCRQYRREDPTRQMRVRNGGVMYMFDPPERRQQLSTDPAPVPGYNPTAEYYEVRFDSSSTGKTPTEVSDMLNEVFHLATVCFRRSGRNIQLVNGQPLYAPPLDVGTMLVWYRIDGTNRLRRQVADNDDAEHQRAVQAAARLTSTIHFAMQRWIPAWPFLRRCIFWLAMIASIVALGYQIYANQETIMAVLRQIMESTQQTIAQSLGRLRYNPTEEDGSVPPGNVPPGSGGNERPEPSQEPSPEAAPASPLRGRGRALQGARDLILGRSSSPPPPPTPSAPTAPSAPSSSSERGWVPEFLRRDDPPEFTPREPPTTEVPPRAEPPPPAPLPPQAPPSSPAFAPGPAPEVPVTPLPANDTERKGMARAAAAFFQLVGWEEVEELDFV